MRLLKDGLYIVGRVKWNQALCYLDSDFFTAKFEVAPGFVLGRPAWPTPEDKRRWLAATGAIEVDPGELNEETKSKLSTFEMMTLA